jgi:anti-sigma factor RsiW
MSGCPDISILEAYHDAELSSAPAADVEAHLASCPACAAALASMRSLSSRFDEFASIDLPAGMLASLHKNVDAGRFSDRAILPLARSLIGVAAAILICATAGLVQIRPARVSAPQPWEGALVLPQDASQVQTSSDTMEPEIIVADLSRSSGR